MTPTQLQAFVTVAQERSFTSAAMVLGMTQSAVSHAIKSIEKELGVMLFARGKAEIVLTDTGQNIVDKAHAILGLHESIRQTANEARNLQQGVLKIGSFGPSFSARLLPIILAEYQKRFPNISVYVDEGEDNVVKEWISQRKVDLGCIILPETELDHVFLTTDCLSVLLPTEHPLATKQVIDIDDLCDTPFIVTEGSTGNMVLEMFKKRQRQPKIHYHKVQIMSMLSLVSEGAGISIAADLASPKTSNEKQASFVKRPLAEPMHRDIALAMQHRKHLSPAAEAFVTLTAKLQRAGRFAHLR